MAQREFIKREPEAHCSIRLFEEGLGQVVLARFRTENTIVEAGVFLLDVWCLGVKNVFFQQLPVSGYDQLLASIRETSPLKTVEPACARKLVEAAAAYAGDLGFAPHPDYKAACRVFGGIATKDCTETFQLGCEGKPHYVQGPQESEVRVHRILQQLRRRCGEGNFHFTIVQGGPGFDWG